MYKIQFNRLDKQYRFKKNGRIVDVGNLEAMTWTALDEGIQNSEIKIAFETMIKNKHTQAEFGINGYFLFSK